MTGKSWQIGAGPGSLLYGAFDRLRRGLNRRLTRFLMAHGVDGPGARILEAGSGPGFASALLGSDPRVRVSVALDLDAEALREGRRRAPGLRAVVGDVYRLPFRSGAFDLVWSSSTFEHLDRPDRALREMAGAARGGCGRVFIGVPYRRGPLAFQTDIARTAAGVWIGPVYDRDRLAALLERHGLRPDRTLIYFTRCFVGILARKEDA